MKMKKMLVGLIVVFTSTLVFAQDSSPIKRGYVEFESLSGLYGEPRVEINLGKSMLKLAGDVSKHSNPENAELFEKLDQIRVLVYDIDDDASGALALIDKLTSRIKQEHWAPIVSVNENGEKVRIFMKETDSIMDGLVVMVVGDGDKLRPGKEAVFINVVGELDPALIGKVTNALNVNTGI